MQSTDKVEVRIKGVDTLIPCISVRGRTVMARGKWLKTAMVHDELYHETVAVDEPEAFVSQLKKGALKADVFAFSQVLPDTQPKYSYPMEWDNLAVTPTNYKEWWEGRLPQEARKNVRRAGKRGVVVKTVPLDDELIRGIQEIFQETPIRQGMRFWHYGKDIETIKKEISTFPERSEFIGAYFENELIGFIKLVYAGNAGGIMAILSKEKHYDKRPTNALLAKAVEVCDQKKVPYLIYGKYIYGNKENSPLADFKGRNGFEKVMIPRYYVPLTVKGRVAIKLGLHKGWTNLLPAGLITRLVKLRAFVVRKAVSKKEADNAPRDEETSKPLPAASNAEAAS